MEEPRHYYDDYKNHIQSKLTNEICKLFNVLKQDSISSIEVRNSILVLSTNVFNYINNCKFSKIHNRIDEISTIEYEIKEAIIELILYKSKKLIESPNTLITLSNLMERSNKEIQLITIVFNKVIKEKNMILNKNIGIEVTPPFRAFYFKHFVEKIVLTNSISIFANIIHRINNIRYAITENGAFEKIINNKNTTHNITDFIKEPDECENYNSVTEILSLLTELDFLTENNFNCINQFNSTYLRNLTKVYSVYSSSIFTIKNTNIKFKFRSILESLTIESFLHDSIFTNSESHKELMKTELIEPNINFIKEIFNKKIINFGEYYETNIMKSKNERICIYTIFEELLDIPHFVLLYIKMYEFGVDIIKDISESLGREIENYFKKIDKTQIGIEFMFLSYIFLKRLEEELLTSFTPLNQEIDNLESVQLNNYVNNKQFTINIHKIFLEIIKEFSHDKFIEFMLCFGRLSLPKKPGKTQEQIFNFYQEVTPIYNKNDILEALKYLFFCAGEKDVLEESIKKCIIKNILHNGLSNFNIDEILNTMNEISLLPNICLKVNTKIIDCYRIGQQLSNEYNIIYDTTNHIKSGLIQKNFLNLKHLPEGICSITPYQYSDEEFLSNSFKEHISVVKGGFTDYYKFKYSKRELKWCDKLTTIDLAFNINNYELCLCVNYRQADILFLLQCELEGKYQELKKLIQVDNLSISNLLVYKEYIQLVEHIDKSEFIQFLIEKKIFKKRVETLSPEVDIHIFEINDGMNLKRDKKVDCFKMKFKDIQQSCVKKNQYEIQQSKKEKNIVFFRSDYAQSKIMKECKRQKHEFIEESKLFTIVRDFVKQRFDLDKSLFSTAVEKLIKNDYIQRGILREVESGSPVVGYKYLP